MSFTFMFNKMYLIVRLFNEILIKTAFNDDLTKFLSWVAFKTLFPSPCFYRVQVPTSLKDSPHHYHPRGRRIGWVQDVFQRGNKINRNAPLLTLKTNSLLYRAVMLHISSYVREGIFASLCEPKGPPKHSLPGKGLMCSKDKY